MNNPSVTGDPIPRRNDVNILEDLADIAQAVKGSGLPEVFFTEQCCVWGQLQALCTYMYLTPRQVTILAVVLEFNGYASLRDIAGYIGCPVGRLHSMHWDIELLRHVEYLKDGEQLYEYIIEPDLIAGWSGNQLYRAFQDPQEAVNNHLLGRVGFEVTRFYALVKVTDDLYDIMNHYLDIYSGCTLLAYVQSLVVASPSPELGTRILLMVAAKNFKSILYENVVGMNEMMRFVHRAVPSSTEPQIREVIDYLVDVGSLIKSEPDTYGLSESVTKEVAKMINYDEAFEVNQ